VATAISAWLEAVAPARLNVAGPRASKDPEIYADAKRLLLGVFDDYLSGA
jgi:hypothetical protein